MILILDASALLSGRMTSIPEGSRVYITSNVFDEIGKGSPRRMLENLVSAGLEIRSTDETSRARELAERTGDLDKLSDADISVIALALETENCTVITDDFRVQNVLSSAEIPFLPGGELGDRTIERTFIWTFRCRGCGRYFEEEPGPDCPICGSAIKKVRKRS